MNPVANLAQVVHALNSAATTVAPAFQSTIIDKLPGPLQSVWSDLSSPAAFTLGFTEGMADGTMSVFNQMADAIPAMASTASSIASCTIFMSCAGLASDLSSAAQAVSTDDPAKIIDSAKHFALDPFADIANHAASGDWNGAGVASGHAAVGVVQVALAVSGICEAVMADSCFLPTIADMMDLADATRAVTGAETAADPVGQSGLWRGAEPGEPPSFEPGPTEYRLDRTTTPPTVKPTRGPSVWDNPQSVVDGGRVPYRVDEQSIPPELQVVPHGPTGHYEIVPASGANLTEPEYLCALAKIRFCS
jgi:hypothetical protein